MIQKKLRRNALFLILPLLAALLSFFVLAGVASSSEFHKHSIAALEEKQTTVLELSAASAAASAAFTLIPGDAATPIAEQLADLSSHFLVVLCAIYLEKYLLTITGFLAFKILIPVACLAYILNVLFDWRGLRLLAGKLAGLRPAHRPGDPGEPPALQYDRGHLSGLHRRHHPIRPGRRRGDRGQRCGGRG